MMKIHSRKKSKNLQNSSLDTSIPFNTNRKILNKNKKLMSENKKLLKRLQNSSPTYNISKWEKDRKKTKKYINLRCQYPYILNKKKKSPKMI
mmetsp:Transcript_17971/g.15891  ORF Transcript_17971/g.15891 Transcript_17971/m.15891 type:complete len:92 (+) Transcript_17971:171-446(+)